MDFNERLTKLLIACVLVAVWFIVIPIPEFTRLSSVPLARITLADMAEPVFWLIGVVVVGDIAFGFCYAAITGEKWGER